jgi:hypothetical protein
MSELLVLEGKRTRSNKISSQRTVSRWSRSVVLAAVSSAWTGGSSLCEQNRPSLVIMSVASREDEVRVRPC